MFLVSLWKHSSPSFFNTKIYNLRYFQIEASEIWSFCSGCFWSLFRIWKKNTWWLRFWDISPLIFSDPWLWYHLVDCFLIFVLKKGEKRSREGNFVSHLGSRRFEQSCFLFTVGTVALRLDLLKKFNNLCFPFSSSSSLSTAKSSSFQSWFRSTIYMLRSHYTTPVQW